MPKPNKGESKNDYISRCIKQVMSEGKNKDQAIGQCEGMWSQHHNVSNMEQITVNLDARQVREGYIAGEPYWVAPMVLMTECVANGSRGPLFYSSDELEKWSPSWNHKPLVLNHPVEGSACTAEYLDKFQFGIVLNTTYNGKQRAEGWFNQKRTSKIEPRIAAAIRNKNMMELSTGLYVDAVPEEGEFEGKKYSARAVNHRPDHVAILPDSVGACSIKDGAGLLQLNELSHEELRGELNELLCELYSKQIKDTPSIGEPWVRAVFDDYVIYWWGGKTFQIGYQKSEGKASLSGDPIEVEQKVEYVPVGNASGDSNPEDISMSKKDLVDKIIKNKVHGFEDGDRKALDVMDEKKLESMAAITDQKKPAFTFATQEELDAAIKDKVDELVKNSKENPDISAKQLTPQEWLAAVPTELKAVHNNMVKAYQAEVGNLVKTIVSNPKNQFKQEDLVKMDIDLLRNMAAIAAPATDPNQQFALPNFFGLGPTPVTQNAEEGLPLPAYNTAKFANRGKSEV